MSKPIGAPSLDFINSLPSELLLEIFEKHVVIDRSPYRRREAAFKLASTCVRWKSLNVGGREAALHSTAQTIALTEMFEQDSQRAAGVRKLYVDFRGDDTTGQGSVAARLIDTLPELRFLDIYSRRYLGREGMASGLGQELVDSIVKLDKLETLGLRMTYNDNEGTETILKAVKSLKSLVLFGFFQSNYIPPSALEELYCYSTSILSPLFSTLIQSNLDSLTSLRMITLERNPVTLSAALTPPPKQLQRLWWISQTRRGVQHTYLDDILPQLTQLRSLELGNGGYSDFACLSALPQLHSLAIHFEWSSTIPIIKHRLDDLAARWAEASHLQEIKIFFPMVEQYGPVGVQESDSEDDLEDNVVAWTRRHSIGALAIKLGRSFLVRGEGVDEI